MSCKIQGKNKVEHVIHYLNDVHCAMEEHHCGKVLIEENLSGPGLNLLNIYHVIRTAKKTVFSLPHAIAYVDSNPAHDHNNMKFAETVARNRHINMRLFINIKDASEWLEGILL
ncbi:MAG: hypothetical protein WDA22_12615 [Bacteroidota bacterium]